MYTSKEVVEGRLCGLKAFDKAVAKAGREKILSDAIATHNDLCYEGIWGPKDCWSHFSWSFGNAWREALDLGGDISDTANLDEMLTPEELDRVRRETGITEPLDFGYPRAGMGWDNMCPRHNKMGRV